MPAAPTATCRNTTGSPRPRSRSARSRNFTISLRAAVSNVANFEKNPASPARKSGRSSRPTTRVNAASSRKLYGNMVAVGDPPARAPCMRTRRRRTRTTSHATRASPTRTQDRRRGARAQPSTAVTPIEYVTIDKGEPHHVHLPPAHRRRRSTASLLPRFPCRWHQLGKRARQAGGAVLPWPVVVGVGAGANHHVWRRRFPQRQGLRHLPCR